MNETTWPLNHDPRHLIQRLICISLTPSRRRLITVHSPRPKNIWLPPHPAQTSRKQCAATLFPNSALPLPLLLCTARRLLLRCQPRWDKNERRNRRSVPVLLPRSFMGQLSHSPSGLKQESAARAHAEHQPNNQVTSPISQNPFPDFV
jgi:hypothetical protein